MSDQIQPGMQCVEVEALLADAIDGTLAWRNPGGL